MAIIKNMLSNNSFIKQSGAIVRIVTIAICAKGAESPELDCTCKFS